MRFWPSRTIEAQVVSAGGQCAPARCPWHLPASRITVSAGGRPASTPPVSIGLQAPGSPRRCFLLHRENRTQQHGRPSAEKSPVLELCFGAGSRLLVSSANANL